MSATPSPWAEYKQAVLDSRDDFSFVFSDLEGIKPSTNGWVTARCPFHEDHNPSFAYERSSGNWKCQAGCDSGSVFDYVARTRGLPFKEALVAFGEELGVPRKELNCAVAVGESSFYDYHDADGTLIYQVVKSPGKKFWSRRRSKEGKWVKGLAGVVRVLYRLPELLARPDEPIYVTEGEKDADAVAGLGLLATSNPNGAGKWTDAYSDSIAGRDVVILPDNDEAGEAHAAQVAEACRGKVSSVRIVRLPELKPKGDVSDWIDTGGSGDQLELLAAETPIWEPETEPAATPAIQLHGRQLSDIVTESWDLLNACNDPPGLFLANAGLARVVTNGDNPTIDVLDEAKAYGLLMRVADWFTRRGDSDVASKPPKEVARDLLANPHPDLPALDAVVTSPVFDKDWRLVADPGYHPDSRLWYSGPVELSDLDLPTYPSSDDVSRARSLILDHLLCDFPFSSESDRAHAVAGLALPFARRMFGGPTPMHMIEAPTPGTGKSLLADLISIIFTGRSCESTTVTRNEDESRKKLTAILSRGAPIVAIDNLQGGMDSAQVSSAITAETWSDRILGKTQMVQFPNLATWLVTANNPKLSMEIARRSVRIRMEPQDERPWERTGFKHDPIREWAGQNRRELVRAVLMLIQHWIASGCPPGAKTLGSFEAWSRVVGGIVTHAGVPGFLQDTEEFYEAADTDSAEWRAFISTWHEEHQSGPVTAAQLMALAADRDLIPFAYAARTEHAQKVRFGKALTALRGRKFGELQVVVDTDSHTKSKTYRLVVTEKRLFK